MLVWANGEGVADLGASVIGVFTSTDFLKPTTFGLSNAL